MAKAANVSAKDCAKNAAGVAGAVAPDCAAVMQLTVILCATHSKHTSTASAPNRSGEIIGLIWAANHGRSENAPSRPSAISIILTMGATWSAKVKEVATGLLVPASKA